MIARKNLRAKGPQNEKFVTTFANSHLLSDKHLRPWIADSNFESQYSKEVDEFEQTLFFVSPYKSFQSGPLDRKTVQGKEQLERDTKHGKVPRKKDLMPAPSPISDHRRPLTSSRLSEDSEILELLQEMKLQQEDSSVSVHSSQFTPINVDRRRHGVPSAFPQLGQKSCSSMQGLGVEGKPRQLLSLSQSQPALGLGNNESEIKRFNEPRRIPRPATAASSRQQSFKPLERAQSAVRATRDQREQENLRRMFERPENTTNLNSSRKEVRGQRSRSNSVGRSSIHSKLESKKFTGPLLRKVQSTKKLQARRRDESARAPRSASWMPRFGSESNLKSPNPANRIRQRAPTPLHAEPVPSDNVSDVDNLVKLDAGSEEPLYSCSDSDLRNTFGELSSPTSWAQRQPRAWATDPQTNDPQTNDLIHSNDKDLMGSDEKPLSRRSSHGVGDSAWKKTNDQLKNFALTRSKKDHTWQLMGQNGVHEDENAWRSEHHQEFRITKEFKDELDRAPVFPEYNIQSSETRLWGEMAIRQGIPMYVSGSMGGQKKM